MVMIFTDFAYSKLFMYVMLISNTGVLELRFDFRYFFSGKSLRFDIDNTLIACYAYALLPVVVAFCLKT